MKPEIKIVIRRNENGGVGFEVQSGTLDPDADMDILLMASVGVAAMRGVVETHDDLLDVAEDVDVSELEDVN